MSLTQTLSYTKGVRRTLTLKNVKTAAKTAAARAFKLTGWYKCNQKPARPGVYERKFKGGLVMYSKWDGHFWAVGDESLWRATHRVEVSSQQCRPWRGLVSA